MAMCTHDPAKEGEKNCFEKEISYLPRGCPTPIHHPCCYNLIAHHAPAARHKVPGCSRGCRRGGRTHRAGRWAQAQSDARIGDTTAWCT
eukprot:1391464-Prymnesium_polylepis.1